jgi:hypothetical protein
MLRIQIVSVGAVKQNALNHGVSGYSLRIYVRAFRVINEADDASGRTCGVPCAIASSLCMYATVTLQISLATCGDLMRLDCSMKGLHNSVVTTFK